jgi:aryl-alcohol dehydrogenase-like predicted oxidoreductase
MGFMAYSPLGRGFFGGQVHDAKDMSDGDGRINHPRFQGDNLAKNLALLGRFEEFARDVLGILGRHSDQLNRQARPWDADDEPSDYQA